MTSLREQLGRFIAELREAGVRISVAEAIDAMKAVATAGLERSRMREALAATLVKEEADRAIFDRTFDRFFAGPPRQAGRRRHPEHPGMAESAASGRGRPGETPHPNERRKPAREPEGKGTAPGEEKHEQSQQMRSEGAEREAGVGESRERALSSLEPGSEGRRLARIREIERKPFSSYTELEYEQAREILKPLERRFRVRLGRRLRIARAGRVDFRRTIRAGIQRGGLMPELRMRSRRPRHVDLLILADISGSVRYAAELMLELMAGARNCFRRVRSFVYIDRLAEADFEQGHMVCSPPLDPYARSDFGRVLAQLWERRAELVNRQTLIVILGDARNNRRPARADLLREIAQLCRGVVWLNPEEPARWGTGDSAIEQYRRAVTALHPSGSLRELERALLAAC